MIEITSPQNPKLKKAIRLHDSRGRKQQGRIIVFGANEISRAIAAGLHIREAYRCLGDSSCDSMLRRIPQSAEVYSLTNELFEKIAFGNRREGLVLVADRPTTEISQFAAEKYSLILVLEAIEKPGNIGAVFRSAVAAGVEAIVLADPVCDVFHPNSIRASLGSVFSVDVFCGASSICKSVLAAGQFQIITTRVDAKNSYHQCDLTAKTAIVLGNESTGLSDQWTGDDLDSVTIPMRRQIDSLNIAMTATLMAFEAQRQRDFTD